MVVYLRSLIRSEEPTIYCRPTATLMADKEKGEGMTKREKFLLLVLFIILLIGVGCPPYAMDNDCIDFGSITDSVQIGTSLAFIGSVQKDVIEVKNDMSEVRLKEDYYKLKEKKDGWIVYEKREKK